MKVAIKMLHIAVAFALFLSLAISAHAADGDVLSFKDFFDADEFQEVQEAVFESEVLYENGVLNEMTTRSGDDGQLANAYKMHSLENINLVTALQDSENLSDFISNDYVWIVTTTSNEAIRVDEINGEWNVLGYSTPASATAATDLVQVNMLNKQLATLSDNQTAATVLQCFEAPMYHTNFVYMSTEDGGFLVPYGSRPDLTGLENGKIYTTQEVCDILAASFDGVYDSAENAGVGAHVPDENVNAAINHTGEVPVMLIVGGAVVLIAAIGLTFFIGKRKVK